MRPVAAGRDRGTRILYRSSLKRSLYVGDQLGRVIRYKGDRNQIFQYQRKADRRYRVPVAAPDVGTETRPGSEWAKGSWRLSLDPYTALGIELPMDVMQFRPDGKVGLSKRTRAYATCPYAVYGYILTVRCQHRRHQEPLVFDLAISTDQHPHHGDGQSIHSQVTPVPSPARRPGGQAVFPRNQWLPLRFSTPNAVEGPMEVG